MLVRCHWLYHIFYINIRTFHCCICIATSSQLCEDECVCVCVCVFVLFCMTVIVGEKRFIVVSMRPKPGTSVCMMDIIILCFYKKHLKGFTL